MPERAVTDRLDDRITEQDGRLRTVETWAVKHETMCEGRHKEIQGQFDRLRAALEDVREAAVSAASAAASAAEAAAVAVKVAEVTAAAAVKRGATILLWAKATFGAAAGGLALWGGTQAEIGRLLLWLLGKP